MSELLKNVFEDYGVAGCCDQFSMDISILSYCSSRRIPHTIVIHLSITEFLVQLSQCPILENSIELRLTQLPRLSLCVCLRDIAEIKRSGTSIQLADIKVVENLKRLLSQ